MSKFSNQGLICILLSVQLFSYLNYDLFQVRILVIAKNASVVGFFQTYSRFKDPDSPDNDTY